MSEAQELCWVIPVHFMFPGISSYVIGVMLSCVGIEMVSPTITLRLLWLICSCLQRIGE